jgi:hypothetical protein
VVGVLVKLPKLNVGLGASEDVVADGVFEPEVAGVEELRLANKPLALPGFELKRLAPVLPAPEKRELVAGVCAASAAFDVPDRPAKFCCPAAPNKFVGGFEAWLLSVGGGPAGVVEVPPKNLLGAGVDSPAGPDVEALLVEALTFVWGCLLKLLPNNPPLGVAVGALFSLLPVGVEAPLSFF